jgi:A/G-specific adenine glycosylase
MFKKLIKWSKDEYSSLPWRKNRSLYGTLVSEIMLQQTTVPTVINHFEKFLTKFPDLNTLSRASQEEMLIAWKGLGYYRRAKNLKMAAKDILENHQGKIPDNIQLLKEISGIGEYTANAIVAIGHNKNALSLDANLERVLCRVFSLPLVKGPKLKKELTEELQNTGIVQKFNNYSSRDLMEALMDLGRTFCQANKVNCLSCPMKSNCKAYKMGRPLDFPKVQFKEKLFFDLDLLRIVIKKGSRIFLIERKMGTWLEDQWELPTFIIKSDDKKIVQYPFLREKSLKIPKTFSFKTNITNYKIKNYILEMEEKDFRKLFKEFPKGKYFDAKIKDQNFTTATTKALKFL